MVEQKKCTLKQCLMFDKGICGHSLPNIIPKLTPNSIKCILFDCDRAQTYQLFKAHGGMNGELARMNGKKTEQELKEIKKDMRKPREDKGTKRGRKSKEENDNTLKEMI